ncbi:MAG: acyl-CoA/acyl-ACP dehydrogenase [Nocardioidaceae bacterium]|nr:acyl-CoA/acyl-ACP dehydrogenase [Nocardioidaceae bacterium]
METQLNADQVAVRDMVRRICADAAPLDRVRALEDDPVGYDPELRKALAEAGILGMAVPERFGGSALTWTEMAVVHAELGRALAPGPWFASSVLAARLLARTATTDVQRAWLPGIADGSRLVVPAWLEPGGSARATGIALRGEKVPGGYRLSGLKRHVPCASSADRLLVLFGTDAGTAIALVDPAGPGVDLEQAFSLASDTQYDVRLDDVHVADDDLVGRPGEGWSHWSATLGEALAPLAAYAVGGAERALELTVDYARTREQFGKPLGAFQALAHELADCATEVSGAELIAYRAADALDRGAPEAGRLAAMAKLYACETFRHVTRSGEQIFGGVGFTLEFDIQLYFRRAKQLELSWWSPPELEDRIADDLLTA